MERCRREGGEEGREPRGDDGDQPLARLDAALATAPGAGLKAFLFDSGTDTPFTAGCCGSAGLLLESVGLENIAGDVEGRWADLSWEAVVIADPDVIVLNDAGWSTAADKQAYLEADPVLSQLRAVREQRYISVPFSETVLGVRFVDGAVERGVPAAKASDIFDQVAKFAGYGFNKSHAAAYALVAYQTAYLKANYPVEFLAASMTFDMGNTDKLNVFRQELQRLDIALLPPDINRSEVVFSVERAKPEDKGAIRYALAAVKNVGAQAMGLLIEERRKAGPFKSLGDFAQRADPRSLNKRQLENLVASGAFDGLERNRAKLYEGLEVLLRHASAAAQDRVSDQVSLFAGAATETPTIPLRERPDWPILEKLQFEFDALGFYLSAHPLDAYGTSLQRIEVIESANLLPLLSASGGSKRVRLAGNLVSKQERMSKSGNRFAFVTLTDRSGVFEVTLFSEILATSRELIESGQPLLVTADARAEGESYRLLANAVEPLDRAVANAVTGLKVFLRDEAPLPHLKTLFQSQGQGRGRVRFVLDIEEQEVELVLPGSYQINAGMRAAIKSIPGIVDVRDI